MKIEIDGVEYLTKLQVLGELRVNEKELMQSPISMMRSKRIEDYDLRSPRVYRKSDVMHIKKIMNIAENPDRHDFIFAGKRYKGFYDLAKENNLGIWAVLGWIEVSEMEKVIEEEARR